VSVGASLLARGTLAPDLAACADLVGVAIVSAALPETVGACASVASLLAYSSTGIVDSLVEALAVSYWNALVGFFVKSLTWKTVASGNALFCAAFWLSKSACLAIALTTFLVDLASRACHGAWSACPPVSDDLSSESAFTGVRSEGCALGVDSTICTAPRGAYVLLAHLYEVLGVNDGVAAAEVTSLKSIALLFGEA